MLTLSLFIVCYFVQFCVYTSLYYICTRHCIASRYRGINYTLTLTMSGGGGRTRPRHVERWQPNAAAPCRAVGLWWPNAAAPCRAVAAERGRIISGGGGRTMSGGGGRMQPRHVGQWRPNAAASCRVVEAAECGRAMSGSGGRTRPRHVERSRPYHVGLPQWAAVLKSTSPWYIRVLTAPLPNQFVLFGRS